MKTLEPLRIDPDGTHLIEASAGTGKTYTIGTLVQRLVIQRGLRPEQILVVTFTEAASADLKRRLRERLSATLAMCEGRLTADEVLAGICPADERERAAVRVRRVLLDFDRMAIHTIHGFCKATLEQYAFESGVAFDPETEPDPRPLVQEVVADFWALESVRLDPLVVAALQKKGPGLAEMVDLVMTTLGQPDRQMLPADVPERDAVGVFLAAYQRVRELWLTRRGVVEGLILQRDCYHKSWFSPEIRQRSLREVDAFLGPQTPLTPLLPEGFARLKPAKLTRVTNKGNEPPEDPFFDACQDLVAASELFATEPVGLQLRLIAYAGEQLAQRKLERNLQTFDDLLQRLDRALEGEGGEALAARVRGRYAAVLVDEFQDTDRIQARIFERLFAGQPEPLVFVGDPKQSIYAFRGADLYAYLETAELAGDRRASLDTNWRSSPGLVAAVNRLFGRCEEQGQRPFVDERIQFRPVASRPDAQDLLGSGGGPAAALQLRFVPRAGRENKQGVLNKDWIERNLADMVAADLVRLFQGETRLAGQPIRPGQVAVLLRTNEQARQVQAALSARRVPAVLVSAGTVFASPEAMEFARLLPALANPASGRALRAALATDLLGVRGDQLAAMDAVEPSAQAAVEAWSERFHALEQVWRRQGFVHMARQLLFGAAPSAPQPPVVRLLGYPDGERRVTNLLQLVELLHAAAVGEHLGPSGLLGWLERKLAAGDTRVDSDQLRLESDAQAVKLVTIHKSKGLEFPVVYCPTLWDVQADPRAPIAFQRVDDGSGRAQAFLDLGSEQVDQSLAAARQEALAEAMRLTYVALTRAEQLCICVWGALSGYDRAPLGRLLHLPGPPDDLAALKAPLRAMSDADMLADLHALAASSDGAIAVAELPPADQRPFEPAALSGVSLSCRTVTRHLERSFRVTSFSGIAAGGHTLDPAAQEGRDHDVGVISADPPPTADDARSPLADLVRGPRTGDCLHALLEELDFERAEGAHLADLARQKQQAFGLPDVALGDLERAVGAVLDTGLDHDRPNLRLRGLPGRDRLNELQFLVPTRGALSPAALAEAVREHGAGVIPEAYSERLARLQPRSIEGFLRGFIDLVFVHQGRWYVIDYKSNHLGDTFADYAQDRLAQAMADHHYYLQYLIYTLAVDRLLRYRMPDYDPAEHLGGVYYLFLRGMRPGHGPDSGVFHHRPSHQLLKAVAAALGLGGRP